MAWRKESLHPYGNYPPKEYMGKRILTILTILFKSQKKLILKDMQQKRERHLSKFHRKKKDKIIAEKRNKIMQRNEFNKNKPNFAPNVDKDQINEVIAFCVHIGTIEEISLKLVNEHRQRISKIADWLEQGLIFTTTGSFYKHKALETLLRMIGTTYTDLDYKRAIIAIIYICLKSK